MTKYRVFWAANLEAETPEEAAGKARLLQLAPGSAATVFTVAEVDEYGNVDMMESETIDAYDHMHNSREIH